VEKISKSSLLIFIIANKEMKQEAIEQRILLFFISLVMKNYTRMD
jgi:hypothetical protein